MRSIFSRHWLAIIAMLGDCPGASAQHSQNVANNRVDRSKAYSFRPMELPVRYRLPDGRVARGKLNLYGDFVPDPNGDEAASAGVIAINDPNMSLGGDPRFSTTEDVFEYRTGLLIRGILTVGSTNTTRFIPRVGSKIIEFKEYPIGVSSLRIYNLPGQFVPADDKPKENKAGAKK